MPGRQQKPFDKPVLRELEQWTSRTRTTEYGLISTHHDSDPETGAQIATMVAFDPVTGKGVAQILTTRLTDEGWVVTTVVVSLDDDQQQTVNARKTRVVIPPRESDESD